jgi:hypothetical protein
MSLSRPTRSTVAKVLAPAVIAGALLLPQSQSPASAEDPIAGGQTSPGDVMLPNVGNTGYDVAHYDIDIAWTPTGFTTTTPVLVTGDIVASAAIRANTTGAPLSSYSLDFEGAGLTVSSVTVDGAPATFTRDEQPANIRHKLIVTPATPVSGEFTTVVEYAGTPSRHVDLDGSWEGWNMTNDGVTFLNQPIGAMTGYPSNNTPNDKATFTFDIDIPNEITNAAGTGAAAAASNGELVDRVANGANRTTWRWVQNEPMATELSMISIGKYDMHVGEITLSDGRVIPEWTFVDSAISLTNKTAIQNRRPAQGPITRALEAIWGPYPGNSHGAVIDTVPSGINYALETQDRSFFPSTGSFTGNTLIHEIAHQWYGNNVSPKIWTDIWINEGMGTWAPTYYNSVGANPPTSTNSTHFTYWNSWNGTSPTSSSWTTPPARQVTSANLYGYQTYTRSAQMYEALKLSIGDTAFFAFQREWNTRYAGKSAGFTEFTELAKEISGKDLDAFFTDWLVDADKPVWPQRYDLALASAPANGDTDVQPGDTVSYTLTAKNMGRVQLSPAGGAASVATVDLTDVLDDATIDAAALPAGLALEGTTLTWTIPTTAVGTFVPNGANVPTTAPESTVTFPVVVKDTASLTSLTATAASQTLAGFCAPAGACTTTVDVPIQPLTPAVDPVVTGTPTVGVPLRADTSEWAEGTTFTYQWSVGGTAVDGATAETFTPRPADLGKRVRVTVTGSKDRYTPVTLTSASSAPVVEGTQVPGTPTISGTPRVGATLTGSPGTWLPGTTFFYQWRVDDVIVDGATGTTFVPRVADLGKVVHFDVLAMAPGYRNAEASSAPAGPVTEGTPSPAPYPTVIGFPRVGQELSVTPGTWQAGTTFTYQWNVDGAPVQGATSSTYTPAPADLGKVVTVTVTGSQPGYTASRTSGPSQAVAPGTLASTPVPTISGEPAVGAALTAVPGTWDAGVTLSYQWSVNRSAIGGATGATFVPRPSDVGKSITVAVTGTKPAYTTVTRTSEAVGPVTSGELVAGTPTIDGTPQVGVTLTGDAGEWPSGTTFAYQWSVDGAPVAGATGLTFTPRAADVDLPVTFTVTGSRTGYEPATATSAPSADVVPGELTLTPVPAVSGVRQVGRTLTAVPGTWDAGVTLAYAWTRNGQPIPGATRPTYTLVAADRGATVRVVVVGTKPGYETAFGTSAPGAAVAPGRLTLTPVPKVNGRPVVGATLRAVKGQHDAGTSVSYRWLVGGVPVTGPRGAGVTYTPVAKDRGKKVRVRTTVSKPGYTAVTRSSTPTAKVR